MPYELRRLFATLLVYTCPNSPRQLWLSFEDAMLEDILRHHKETRKESKLRAFEQIDCFLQSMGRRLNEFDVLPRDFSGSVFEDETKEIKAEKSIVVSRASTTRNSPLQMKVPLVITLWNQFDEHEGRMLQAMKGQPALIFGLPISLTTRPNSGFLVNPPVGQELQLHNWFNNNRDEIQNLLSMSNYRKSDLLLLYPDDEDIVSIHTATARFQSVKTAWIAGKLSLPTQERGLSYTACANCHKSLEADTSWIVMCPSCRVESEIQEMSRITVLISDASGFLKANMTTPEIEKFIPFSAKDVKIAGDNATAIESVSIIAFIRAYEVHFHGTIDMRVNIVKAYKPTDKPFVDTNPEILENISFAAPSILPQKGNPSHVPISQNLSSNAEPFPTIYLLPQTKPSPVVISKHTVSFQRLKRQHPLRLHRKFQRRTQVPSTLHKTTSVAPLHQPAPTSVPTSNTPEVNDPRPSKKSK
ncbi:hypothetical protein L2E82_32534 [Cichorium intybus]|uniref:Uncharacterized protein n=1 Tax=Cichorium intybus TaxID=13427 RepID=A0ACB9BH27_CICIN|nr:hypothetical protein L2E82_32534 [Cichorium intybus]